MDDWIYEVASDMERGLGTRGTSKKQRAFKVHDGMWFCFTRAMIELAHAWRIKGKNLNLIGCELRLCRIFKNA